MSTRLDRARARLEAAEAAFHTFARRTVGVRVVDGLGWTRVFRLFAAGYWLLAFLIGGTILRPDLLHPSDLGSDTSNYVAAAERLAAGHDIYSLRPGDRPVPLDNAPEWTVPILSPPSVATAWLPTVALPDGFRLYPVWALGMAATVAAGFLVTSFAPVLIVVLAIQFLPGLAITAWSGNVNALIAGAIAAIWWGVRTGGPWPMRIGGGLAAVATGLKLGPVVIAFWVFTQWRRQATTALIGVGAAFLAITVLTAGLEPWSQYIDIVRARIGYPDRLSVPGLLIDAGVPANLASSFGLPIALSMVAVAVIALRARPLGFGIAVVGSIFATSVVRFETVALWIVAGTAWAGRGLVLRASAASPSAANEPTRGRVAVRLSVSAGVLIAMIVVARSVMTGGLVQSSLLVDNRLEQPVTIRLSGLGQPASFGFLVPPRQSLSGWRHLVAGSPPIATIWTLDCQLIGQIALPWSGGRVVLEPSGPRLVEAVGPDGLDATPQFAAYVSNCAAETREQLKTPSVRAVPGEP